MIESGTYLANRYEIQEKIGSGGMADVYKAKDTALNRLVAVKILKHEYSTDATFVKKFKVEAQSAAGLSHPNIVGVYDVGEERGIYYIVMELVQGITLKNYIDMKGKLGIREALNISVQIANGLSCAHEHRIIHRDIKPQNIIMSRDGKVKVTDFGIAKVADSTTVTTTAAGTVHYISPEQARGGYSDEKSDIYSLGITMYEMLTGRVPFEGETNVAVALLHIQGTMTPPRELEPSIPVSFEKIILKCTQKKPDRRYASAKELIVDLRQVLTHPDGEYVVLPGFVPEGSTIVMKEDELNTIKKAAAGAETKVLASDDIEKELLENKNRKKASKPAKPVEVEQDDDDDEEVSPALSKVMTGLGIGGFIVLVVIIVFFLANILGLFGDGIFSGKTSDKETEQSTETVETVETVEVPDLYGMTEAQARSSLRGKGLVIDVEKGSSNDVEKGEIYKQSPEAGEEAESGSTVTVYISTGKDTEELYDVSDMDYTQAQAKLENLGYTVKLEFENSDTVDKDKVIRTVPTAGSQVSAGDTITIYASSGKETKTVTMPDLHGDSLDEAVSEIQAAGLVYGGKYTDYSDTYDEGEVMLQSINAGATIDEGTTVTITISLGQKETTRTSYSGTVYVESPFGCDIDDGSGEAQVYDEGEVTIIVEMPDGSSETIYDRDCSDSSLPSSLSVSCSSSGTGTAYFYINGVEYDTASVYFD